MPQRNAVALVTDANLLTPALFAAARLAVLNPRRDTDVIVFVSDPALADQARRLPLPFQVRPLVPPAAHAGTALATPHFLRLHIPATLGKAYRRLLYLDVDTWVENAGPFLPLRSRPRGQCAGGRPRPAHRVRRAARPSARRSWVPARANT